MHSLALRACIHAVRCGAEGRNRRHIIHRSHPSKADLLAGASGWCAGRAQPKSEPLQPGGRPGRAQAAWGSGGPPRPPGDDLASRDRAPVARPLRNGAAPCPIRGQGESVTPSTSRRQEAEGAGHRHDRYLRNPSGDRRRTRRVEPSRGQRLRNDDVGRGLYGCVTAWKTWPSLPSLSFRADALVPAGSLPDRVSPPSGEPMPRSPAGGFGGSMCGSTHTRLPSSPRSPSRPIPRLGAPVRGPATVFHRRGTNSTKATARHAPPTTLRSALRSM